MRVGVLRYVWLNIPSRCLGTAVNCGHFGLEEILLWFLSLKLENVI